MIIMKEAEQVVKLSVSKNIEPIHNDIDYRLNS
jgi:hypothetical protein